MVKLLCQHKFDLDKINAAFVVENNKPTVLIGEKKLTKSCVVGAIGVGVMSYFRFHQTRPGDINSQDGLSNISVRLAAEAWRFYLKTMFGVKKFSFHSR